MPLKLINISKKFGDKVILDRFSYEFDDVGIYAIKGESGRGKTTLIRIISNLDKEYEGTVEGNESVSVAFQEYRLFPTLSALDNITEISYPDADESDITKTVDLLKKLKFNESDLSLFPSELSGGMKQRINFARAYLKDSKILILDEITKELDSEIKGIMLSLIKEASEHRLVIVISHDQDDLISLGAKVISL